MDLLGGYNSASDASASDEDVAETRPRAAPVSEAVEGPSLPVAVAARGATGSEGQQGLLAGIPAPRKRPRRAIQLQIPVNIAPDSDEEDEKPRKKVKATTKGLKLSEVLPPPKQVEKASTAGLLGAGFAQNGVNKVALADSDDEMAGPDPYRSETILGEGSEAYRSFDDPGDLPTTTGRAHMHDYTRGTGGGAVGVPPGVQGIGDQMLQQALQEEAAKAAKNGLVADPFSGVNFKEVKQEKLTYIPPEQKEARNATRTAFGADYEARIREEAGPQPQKVARQKHQIYSLYHQAKMKELEMMELRGQAVKTRRETQAKYGWS